MSMLCEYLIYSGGPQDKKKSGLNKLKQNKKVYF